MSEIESAPWRSELTSVLEDDKDSSGESTLLSKISQSMNCDVKDVTEKLGNNPGVVSNYRQFVRAILDAEIPKSTHLAKNCERAVRSFANRNSEKMQDASKKHLADVVSSCAIQASNDTQISLEEQENKKSANILLNKPGVYAYTFEHFRKYPVVTSEDGVTDERTYIKIGITKNEVKGRVRGQTTGMPESPVFLYIFNPSQGSGMTLVDIERMIHEHLKTIGHRRKIGRGTSKEWFVTNEETLESIASLMQLEKTYSSTETKD